MTLEERIRAAIEQRKELLRVAHMRKRKDGTPYGEVSGEGAMRVWDCGIMLELVLKAIKESEDENGISSTP